MSADRQAKKTDKATAFVYTTTRVNKENKEKLAKFKDVKRHILAIEENSSGNQHYQGYIRFGQQVRASYLYNAIEDLQVSICSKNYPEWLSELYITNVEEWKKECTENEHYTQYLHEKTQGEIIFNIGKNKDKKHVENVNEKMMTQQYMRLLDGGEVGDILKEHPLLCAMGNNHDRLCNADRLFKLRKRYLDGEISEHVFNSAARLPWSSYKRQKYENPQAVYMDGENS